MTTQLDPFETRVLAELRSHVSERSDAPAPADAPAPRRTTSWWVAGLGAAASIAVAGVVILPGLGSTPAYSVQEGNSDRADTRPVSCPTAAR